MRLSSWSRYDLGQHKPSCTDHWAKRRALCIAAGGERCLSPFVPGPQPSFDDLLVDGLKMPGNQAQCNKHCPAKEKMRTSFNERAKAGFQYWLIDRPKPTTFGKYGMGSYKTVLGIGNAPRT